MSVYFHTSRKEWTYDFQYRKRRYTAGGFRTKREAMRAEAGRKEDAQLQREDSSPKDMAFSELLLRRLEHVEAYNSWWYLQKHRHMAKRWSREWGDLLCVEITKSMVKSYLKRRKEAVSSIAANKDLRHLRACFNWGKGEDLVVCNPCDDVSFFPEEKRKPYVPPPEDIDKVISIVTPDSQDYLWLIRDTMARCGEINDLRWEDVDFENREITLYTRKKRGGHRTPRQVPMTQMAYNILKKRNEHRDPDVPWVFWRYSCDSETGEMVKGPYPYRKDLLLRACDRAGIRRFSYHALRHCGASILDAVGVAEAEIQEILGHDNRSTTHHYLQRIIKANRSAIEAMERATMKSRLRVEAGAGEKSHQKSHQDGKRSLKVVSDSKVSS
jgi:integrase